MEKHEVISMLSCTNLMDDRVFYGSLRGKEFLVLYMKKGENDKPAFATSGVCPELAHPDRPIVVWYKGECRGVYKRTDPMYQDGDVYRYPMRFMMSI